MTSNEIRNQFLKFFESKNHHVVPSAPMVIKNDPTLMSKEEYFRRLDEAEKGPKYKMLPNESLDDMLTRLGYV